MICPLNKCFSVTFVTEMQTIGCTRCQLGFSRQPQRDAKLRLLHKSRGVWIPDSHSTFPLCVGNRAGGHLVQSTQVTPDLGDGGETDDEPHKRDLAKNCWRFIVYLL